MIHCVRLTGIQADDMVDVFRKNKTFSASSVPEVGCYLSDVRSVDIVVAFSTHVRLYATKKRVGRCGATFGIF
jgi:hypothetical protein